MDSLPCIGGPLDGQSFASRYPGGFVVVRRGDPSQQSMSWAYRTKQGQHVAHAVPRPVTLSDVRHIAEATDFDVVAYDPERMWPW